jgi:predicted RNA binding protein YcfA (HicA-like mRNA interferase family)
VGEDELDRHVAGVAEGRPAQPDAEQAVRHDHGHGQERAARAERPDGFLESGAESHGQETPASGPVLSEVAHTIRGVRAERTLEQARSGSRNLRFSDVTRLVERLGFKLSRVKGSHHIFSHSAIAELVNLQSVNGKCKPYQVKQVLDLIDRYNLKLEPEK